MRFIYFLNYVYQKVSISSTIITYIIETTKINYSQSILTKVTLVLHNARCKFQVIAVENNMQTPKSFGGYFGVLNISMFFIVILYVGMGFLGYWRYGENAEPSITLNLPKDEL